MQNDGRKAVQGMRPLFGTQYRKTPRTHSCPGRLTSPNAHTGLPRIEVRLYLFDKLEGASKNCPFAFWVDFSPNNSF